MREIKSAEEIVKFGNEGYPLRDVIDNLSNEEIIGCFIEYVSQFIDLAAEQAEAEYCEHPYENEIQVNKESILKLKELIK